MKVSTATHLLIAACVVVYFNLEPRPGFVAAFVCEPSRLAYYTPVTSLFLHRDAGHLALNMAALWIVSTGLESFGGLRYLALFIAGGALAHLAQALFCLAQGAPAETMIAGASGGVAAVVGARLALYPRERVTVFVFGAERQMLFAWGVGAWALSEIVAAMLPGMRRAWVAHLAGLAFGYLLARLLQRRVDKPNKVRTGRDFEMTRTNSERRGRVHLALL